MPRKIFVSYKHTDGQVQPNRYGRTARAYVDHLIDVFEGDEIYKGEGDEDLSRFKDDTIKTKLKDKIHDSSITIVLISPDMKELYKLESDQWIPWEISYSLKEITRNDRVSHPNAILAVVLPDMIGSYTYYLKDNTCPLCNCRIYNTGILFQILRKNMFNIKKPTFNGCRNHPVNAIFSGEFSYILSVRWDEFVSNKDSYIERAVAICNNIKFYNVVKEV